MLPPGPGKYDRYSGFGREGISKSIGVPDSYLDKRHKKRAQNSPGPGDYNYTDMIKHEFALNNDQYG